MGNRNYCENKIKNVFYLPEVHGNLNNYFEMEIFSVLTEYFCLQHKYVCVLYIKQRLIKRLKNSYW